MKQDLTTGTWQDDTGCPISIILVSTSDAPAPAAAAASALLTLSTTANVGRPALQTITTVPAAVSVVGGIDASILPSPERKVGKMSHQDQIGKQNKRKHKAVHNQAHARATTLVAKEKMKPKENSQMTRRPHR